MRFRAPKRAPLEVGGRYTRGPVRFDAGLFFGLTSIDPSVGLAIRNVELT